MRRPGIIPPGKAGLIMLAFVAAPILIKEAKPIGRAIVKGIKWLGEAAERIFDQSQIDAKEEPKAEPEPKKAASKTRSKPKSRASKPKPAS